MLASIVTGIALAPEAQQPLFEVMQARLIAGAGLEGDRYGKGVGSYQKNGAGERQLTLIDRKHLLSAGYMFQQSRRNIEVVGEVDLMRLFTASGGVLFRLGEATCRGVKYCDPCNVPSKLAGRKGSFKNDLWGCGGLIVEVVESGKIWVGCRLEVDLKSYD